MEKRKRELGIHSSIVRSSTAHDGEEDGSIMTRRYSAHKLNNISEGLTVTSRYPYPQHKYNDDEMGYDSDTVGSGMGSGSGSGVIATTTTTNPLHAYDMI